MYCIEIFNNQDKYNKDFKRINDIINDIQTKIEDIKKISSEIENIIITQKQTANSSIEFDLKQSKQESNIMNGNEHDVWNKVCNMLWYIPSKKMINEYNSETEF